MILYYLKSPDKYNSIATVISELAANKTDVKLHVYSYKNIPKEYEKQLSRELGIYGHESKLESWR